MKLSEIVCDVFKNSPVFRIGKDILSVDRISAAIGVAIYNPVIDKTFTSVFKRADNEMYIRKKEMKAQGTE